MTTITDSDIEIAVQAATSFVQLYYAAYDATTRTEDVPKFYRSFSVISWNGEAMKGQDELAKVLNTMPASVHTVQSFDCHPVPNTLGPALMVSVSGTVQHGPQPPTPLASTVEKKEKSGSGSSRSVDGQPRVFAQTFILTRDTGTEGDEGEKKAGSTTTTNGAASPTNGIAAAPTDPSKLGRYVIKADSFRFVG